jgi:3-methyl-2-oxobutanoate hydroxymethyltransferase
MGIMSETKTKRVTVASLLAKKPNGQKITMLTAYDYPTARLVDEAGIDMVLVGDSLGMAELGYKSTIPVTLADMLHHVKAVRRGTRRALVVSDMPFLTFQVSPEAALINAGRLIQEGEADSLKIEGGEEIAPTIKRLVDAGMPVVGHIGLQPQKAMVTGMSVQGRTDEAAQQMMRDAKALQDAGAFAIVLELTPKTLAGEISRSLTIPTIGIGSGPECDGQVLVTADMVGLQLGGHAYRHVKKYADVADVMMKAITAYRDDVESSAFPTSEHSVD